MFKYLFLLFIPVFGHGRITNPIPRVKNVDGGLNAPIYTCLGPAFKTSSTSMRCHDTPAANIVGTYNSGDIINLEWIMEAAHPGDCSIWLSYDTNIDSPVNWIKLKDIPGCLSPNGIDAPLGINRYSLQLPDFLPSCEHCVLRWEWYAVQQVSNVEFYVNCIDIKIISQNNCKIPQPTTEINGIEHLLYNLNDANQRGCPFYNVYDSNVRPPLDKRSRGPKEWIPSCNNDIIVPTIPQPPVIIYPCTNINCGNFGSCNNGKCVCIKGYTGVNCEIKPPIDCNINCKVFNRNICQTNNICGNCLQGFKGENNRNSLCKVKCNNNFCNSLNRKKCTSPNICGNCLNGFTEPKSKKRNDACNVVNISNNGIKLSVTAQWDTGFCGQWITTCPNDRIILFSIPNELIDVRGWSMINMQKKGNLIAGFCPEWVQTSKQAIGGFCASHSFGKNIIVNNNGFVFDNSNTLRRRYLIIDGENYMDNTYKNVSITMNMDSNNINYETILNGIQNNLYGSGSDVILLDDENLEISLKIDCKNRQDFDSALFLHMDNINDIPINLETFYKEPINDEYDMSSSSILEINFFLHFVFFTIIVYTWSIWSSTAI